MDIKEVFMKSEVLGEVIAEIKHWHGEDEEDRPAGWNRCLHNMAKDAEQDTVDKVAQIYQDANTDPGEMVIELAELLGAAMLTLNRAGLKITNGGIECTITVKEE